MADEPPSITAPDAFASDAAHGASAGLLQRLGVPQGGQPFFFIGRCGDGFEAISAIKLGAVIPAKNIFDDPCAHP